MDAEYSVGQGPSFRLNLQMVSDFMEERDWDYIVYRPGEAPLLKKCLLYYGQRPLSQDTLYVIPEGSEGDFPADRFSYITTTALRGEAPHIRSVQCGFAELLNHVMGVFSFYGDFERELCNTISSGGSLSHRSVSRGRGDV